MLRRQIQLGALLAAGLMLSGCGSLFEELDAAAEIQQQWHAEDQQRAATDYVAACNTYGCPSNGNSGTTDTSPPTRESGCPTGLNGVRPSTGTACPQ